MTSVLYHNQILNLYNQIVIAVDIPVYSHTCILWQWLNGPILCRLWSWPDRSIGWQHSVTCWAQCQPWHTELQCLHRTLLRHSSYTRLIFFCAEALMFTVIYLLASRLFLSYCHCLCVSFFLSLSCALYPCLFISLSVIMLFTSSFWPFLFVFVYIMSHCFFFSVSIQFTTSLYISVFAISVPFHSLSLSLPLSFCYCAPHSIICCPSLHLFHSLSFSSLSLYHHLYTISLM